MSVLDPSSFSTQDRMVVQHLNRQHTNHMETVTELRASVAALQTSVDALRDSLATTLHYYEQRRIVRFLRWLRLL